MLRPGGLLRTWVPGTYINYWPLTFTAYWVEYQLWGLAPLGFHLVNIALHALSAILVWRVLALLRVPGGLLAAALFALHPVNVESVAWIAQLKNTLSLALTLLSVLLYLLSRAGPACRAGPLPALDRPAAPSPARQARTYAAGTWAAVAAFALATLAKGMTLTLPVVLLACAWWQRGRIERRDLWRVVPFLLIAMAMVGMEVSQQHAAAADRRAQRRPVEPDGGGRLRRVVLPLEADLAGQPDVRLSALAPRRGRRAGGSCPACCWRRLSRLAWRWRHSWGRPVLMLIVCYVALLLPVLGFVNIYFMEYSLVADHWQYAAMIVPCAAFAGAAAATRGRRHWCRLPGVVLCLALLATLARLPGGRAACTPTSKRSIGRRSSEIPTVAGPQQPGRRFWRGADRSTRRSGSTSRR